MNIFDEKIIERQDVIDNITPWYCVKGDGSWDIILTDWIHHGYKDTIINYCKKTNVVLQAGGSQGLYPRLLSEFFNTVYTFEPHPLMFHVLVKNCQKNNIVKFNAALSDSCGSFTLVESLEHNSGCHIMQDAPHRDRVAISGSEYTVPIITVDSLNLSDLDLLMLDVETYEYHVILGAIKTIEKFHPVIICEGPPARERYHEKLENLLFGLGYKKSHTLAWDTLYTYDN